MASPPSQYGAISTHVSVRRRTKHTFSPYYMMRNFNSRLRKETNFNVPIAALLSIISIHVSVRRRTQKSNLHYIYIKISTHVSVRRRTMRCHPRPSESCDFNSRLREEPTRMISFALCHICHFNSRLRKETNFRQI